MSFEKINEHKKIDAGCFGRVYKGTHENRPVAVKVVDLKRNNLEQNEENVKREVELMLALPSHPNVVKTITYEMTESKDQLMIVQEFCPNGNLQQYLGNPPHGTKLQESEALNFLNQISLGLQHLRQYDIVHRDLKPANLLLSAQNTLKIADFGTSNILGRGEMAKTFVGTPCYMAPEILLSYIAIDDGITICYGANCDLYSVGVILYQMLTGKYPWLIDDNRNTRCLNHTGLLDLYLELQMERDCFLYREEISPENKKLLERLLELDPTKRLSYEKFFRSDFLVDHTSNPPIPLKGMEELRYEIETNKNYMGITITTSNAIREIENDELKGRLNIGDIVVQVNGQDVDNVYQVVNGIKAVQNGESVRFVIKRWNVNNEDFYRLQTELEEQFEKYLLLFERINGIGEIIQDLKVQRVESVDFPDSPPSLYRENSLTVADKTFQSIQYIVSDALNERKSLQNEVYALKLRNEELEEENEINKTNLQNEIYALKLRLEEETKQNRTPHDDEEEAFSFLMESDMNQSRSSIIEEQKSILRNLTDSDQEIPSPAVDLNPEEVASNCTFEVNQFACFDPVLPDSDTYKGLPTDSYPCRFLHKEDVQYAKRENENVLPDYIYGIIKSVEEHQLDMWGRKKYTIKLERTSMQFSQKSASEG